MKEAKLHIVEARLLSDEKQATGFATMEVAVTPPGDGLGDWQVSFATRDEFPPDKYTLELRNGERGTVIFKESRAASGGAVYRFWGDGRPPASLVAQLA